MKFAHADAFPNPSLVVNGEINWGTSGLTKREYAAIHIMAALASDPNDASHYSMIAKRAVQMTDALLLELEQTRK